MKIWKHEANIEGLNNMSTNTMLEHIGIEWTEIGDDYLIARMPVDKRTHQPMGLLHGGANVVLAESMGSTASVLCLEDMTTHSVVGVEINANHLKSVRSGWVYGTCKAIRVGRKIQVWNIEIRNEKGDLCCVSRLTVAVVAL
jgi:1,4-dihydroxy-2-naphthoyl-CoA hydrolase